MPAHVIHRNRLTGDSAASYAETGTRSTNSSLTITHQKNFENPLNAPGAMAYLIQTTAAAVNPAWSRTNSRTSAATIATFKPAVAPMLTRLERGTRGLFRGMYTGL
jgi:hypothetical protein